MPSTKNLICKICKESFQVPIEGRRFFYTHKYCSDQCRKEAMKISQIKRLENQREKMILEKDKYKNLKGRISKACKNCKKEYLLYASQLKHRGSNYCSRECVKEARGNDRSLPQLKKCLWNEFSKFIRLRDALRTTGNIRRVACITCIEEKDVISVDAGHFYSSTHGSIRFDEKNVHAQCKKCNMPPNSGEQYKYSMRIIELYGREELLRLESMRNLIKKFTRPELLGMIERYKSSVMQMIKEYGNPWVS